MTPFPSEEDTAQKPLEKSDFASAGSAVSKNPEKSALRHVCSVGLLVARKSFREAKRYYEEALKDLPPEESAHRPILESQRDQYEAFAAGDFHRAYETEVTREETYLSLTSQICKAEENSPEEKEALGHFTAFCLAQMDQRPHNELCRSPQGFAAIKTAGKLVHIAAEKKRPSLLAQSVSLMSSLTIAFSETLCDQNGHADLANQTADTALLYLADFVGPYTMPGSKERKDLVMAMETVFAHRTAPTDSSRVLEASLNRAIQSMDRRDAPLAQALMDVIVENDKAMNPPRLRTKVRQFFSGVRQATRKVFG